MINLTRVALAGVFALGFGAIAQAQTFAPSPSVPKLGNSQPGNPVATDGTPLPYDNAANGSALLTGRSAYVDPAGGAAARMDRSARDENFVDGGMGIAGGAVDAGADSVRGIVGGTLGAVGGIVR